MCDIYGAKCHVCGTVIPMHLGDFETKREEVAVSCGKHIPKNIIPNRTMVWFIDYSDIITIQQDHPNVDFDEKWSDQPVVYVKALTDNAWANRLQNNPNVGNSFGVPLDQLKMFHYGLEMWTRGQIAEERSDGA